MNFNTKTCFTQELSAVFLFLLLLLIVAGACCVNQCKWAIKKQKPTLNSSHV